MIVTMTSHKRLVANTTRTGSCHAAPRKIKHCAAVAFPIHPISLQALVSRYIRLCYLNSAYLWPRIVHLVQKTGAQVDYKRVAVAGGGAGERFIGKAALDGSAGRQRIRPLIALVGVVKRDWNKSGSGVIGLDYLI